MDFNGVENITEREFIEAFKQSKYNDIYSDAGLSALYKYYKAQDEELNDRTKLNRQRRQWQIRRDVEGVAHNWDEVKTSNIISYCDEWFTRDENESDEEFIDFLLIELKRWTTIIELPDGYLLEWF